jgi:hypothetical protein
MTQGLPNQTGAGDIQEVDSPQVSPNPQDSASVNGQKILEGTTKFAGLLEKDERLIGGILISVPVVLIALIPFIPEAQRFNLTCLIIGSVLMIGFVLFLLRKYKRLRDREHNRITNELRAANKDLSAKNTALAESKSELQSELVASRNRLRDSTRERRAFLFKLKAKVQKILENSEALLEKDEISKENFLVIEEQIASLSQQIQDTLSILQRTQGSLSDAEDLDAVNSSFERELKRDK